MTIFGDSKEEDREIFAALKKDAQRRRKERADEAHLYLRKVQALVDDGKISIDPNGTWNWKLKGISGQYWPTKGRWQYTSRDVIREAKQRAWVNRSLHKGYSYPLSKTQFGGGIHKFLQWLERQQ